MDVLEDLSYNTRCNLFRIVDEAVWGESSRNIPIREVEDRLLELAQLPPYSECITLHTAPRPGSVAEHKTFLQEVIANDQSSVVIGADGAGSVTREAFNINRVEIPEDQARSDFVLAIALRVPEGEFETGLPLSQYCNVILTLFQHRFLLNASSVDRSGYLNILLSREEWVYMQLFGMAGGARQRCDWGHQGQVYSVDDPDTHDDEFYPAFQHRKGISGPETALWQTVLDGLSMFGLNTGHILNIVGITINVFHSEKYTQKLNDVPGLVDSSSRSPVMGCLVGDAAFPTHFWPGRGMNSAIKEAAVLAFCLASHHCEKRPRGIDEGNREMTSYAAFMHSLQQREHPRRSLVFTCDRRMVGLIKEANADSDSREDVMSDLEGRKDVVQARLSRAWGWGAEDMVSAALFREILSTLSDRELKILRKVGPWPAAPGDEVLAREKIWLVNQRGETPVV